MVPLRHSYAGALQTNGDLLSAAFLQKDQPLFQLPGSELVLVLLGQGTAERLQHMVDRLNSRKILWNNTGLDIEFGASWGMVENGEKLHHTLGQLSWLAEQSCGAHNVLALTNSLEVASGQTTERVLMLARIKHALDAGQFHLYAQPIQKADGSGYYEILARMESEGEIIMTPDRFIPLIAQFNLSHRFDMCVMEKLLVWLHDHPATHAVAAFLCQSDAPDVDAKEVARQICSLFERYGVAPQAVVIEITEEQAFSNSGCSIHKHSAVAGLRFQDRD